MEYFNDHQHEQQAVDRDDQRVRIGTRLERVQQQHCGTDYPQNGRYREQQAEQHVGEDFDLMKDAVSGLAQPSLSLDSS
jgi:hypothetical protein